MSWAVTLILALLAFAALTLVLKVPRASREAIGAALVLGIAGFAWQARPAQPGAPKQAAEQRSASAAALVAARRELAGASARNADRWVVISDAFARNGQFGDAAGVVLGAVEHDPNNAEAWLALANNLVGHAEGTLSPAALYAYQRAAAADPADPGPPFFLGLALAQNGKLAEGRAQWAAMLERAPADTPWRAEMVRRLADLDAFIAARTARREQGR